MRHDPDHVGDAVVQFRPDRQQPVTIVRRRDNAFSAELSAKDLDLSFEETDPCITPSGTGFHQEIEENVEPPGHN